MTLADVVAAVNARLAVALATADVHVHATPPAAPTLPAVWPWPVNGGGPPRDRPATVRIHWVPVPRDNAVSWPDLYAAVDLLDAAFDDPLPAGIVTTGRAWTFDAVDVGNVARDALLYDLTVTYPNC